MFSICVTCLHHKTFSTVVPALGDPRREWPPAVYGHFVNVPTHFNVKLPLISGHLPNADADSHLLVVSTCYNGQCKQIPPFGGHFNQKSLARTQTWDRQFAQIAMLSSGDQRQTNPFIGYVCFTTSTEKSRILFVQPAMLKNRTILSLDQRIEVLWRLGEAHHVERLLPSQCGTTQMACMISKQTRNATVAYVEYKHSRTVCLQYFGCYFALFLGLLQYYSIHNNMTMHILLLIRNIAGGDSIW